jgi:uncharacterized protein (TIGR02118 family)
MRRFSSWLVPTLALAAACTKPADKQAEAPAADTAAAAAPAPAVPQAIVAVIYRTPKSPAAFEQYYSANHLPLVGKVQQEIGFTRADLVRFESALDGSAPAEYRQATLCFNSMDELKKGIATPGFKQVGDDLGNFATGGLTALIGEQQ